jgi:hypothetical protein
MALAVVWVLGIAHTVVVSWFGGWGALLALVLELGIVVGINLSPTFLKFAKQVLQLETSTWDGGLGMDVLSKLGSTVMSGGISSKVQQLSSVAVDGEFLRNVPLFQGLPHSTLGRLGPMMTQEVFAPKEEIVTQGEKGESMFIIEEGQADVEIDGNKVATMGPPDYFGELALEAAESGGIRTATVRAGAHGAHCFKLVRRFKSLGFLLSNAACSTGRSLNLNRAVRGGRIARNTGRCWQRAAMQSLPSPRQRRNTYLLRGYKALSL